MLLKSIIGELLEFDHFFVFMLKLSDRLSHRSSKLLVALQQFFVLSFHFADFESESCCLLFVSGQSMLFMARLSYLLLILRYYLLMVCQY